MQCSVDLSNTKQKSQLMFPRSSWEALSQQWQKLVEMTSSPSLPITPELMIQVGRFKILFYGECSWTSLKSKAEQFPASLSGLMLSLLNVVLFSTFPRAQKLILRFKNKHRKMCKTFKIQLHLQRKGRWHWLIGSRLLLNLRSPQLMSDSSTASSGILEPYISDITYHWLLPHY